MATKSRISIRWNTLIAIVYSLISPLEYFARKIYRAVDGPGTNDNKQIRYIVTRAEVDMNII